MLSDGGPRGRTEELRIEPDIGGAILAEEISKSDIEAVVLALRISNIVKMPVVYG